MTFHSTTSLGETRRWIVENAQKGCICPCCGQRVQVYKRTLNSSLAAFLNHLNKATIELDPPDGWIHVNKEMIQLRNAPISRDYSVMRFWGLIEPKLSKETNTGFWRLTLFGQDFIKGKVEAPRHVWLFNNQLLRKSEETVKFKDIIKIPFKIEGLLHPEE